MFQPHFILLLMAAAVNTQAQQWIAERRSRVEQLRDNVDRVVFVVGTALSMSIADSITDPQLLQWKGLLLNALQHLENISDSGSKVAQSIIKHRATLEAKEADTEEYVAASEFIRRNMQEQTTEFAKWLAARFGKGSLRIRTPGDNVHVPLHQLHAQGAKLLTVNYDGLLEDTAPSDQPFKVLHRSDPHAAEEWMHSNPKIPRERGVFHLHGHWSRANDVVFGLTDYTLAVHKDNKLQELMRSLKHKTVVFLGCSGTLSDPNFKNTLDLWVSQLEKDGPSGHSFNWYVALRETDMVRFLKLKIPFVIPLCYGKKHEHLQNFLRQVLSSQPSLNLVHITVTPMSALSAHFSLFLCLCWLVSG